MQFASFVYSFIIIPMALSQGVQISSSHLAQFIYPDETLTITLTASSPEIFEDGVIVQTLDVNNNLVSERTLQPTEPGLIVDEISGLDLGLYAYHVQSTSQPINQSTPLAWTRLVVAPRPDPTIAPEESPIAVDAWLAWRFPGDTESMERAAHLMQRMGIRWVRDRLSWNHVQPERDDLWDWSRCDDCYRIQSEAGLRVIPVFHDVARWASPTGDYEPAHRPTDLQDLVTFTREAALHFGNTIAGIEIANEFNSPIFWRGGSHDLAAYMKAAAAGLWQGNPDLIRLMGSSTDALDRLPGLADAQGAIDNNVLAWVDVVTPHHYGPPHGLTTHIEWYREHAPRHPIWVTETGSTAIPEVGPFVSDEEREQAAYLVNAFERALDAGAERVFYFCLTDFFEHGERPFGLVECHGDLWTPRPGLFELARLAATTRLDDRVAARMSERVDREIPPVFVTMAASPERGIEMHPSLFPDDSPRGRFSLIRTWTGGTDAPLPPAAMDAPGFLIWLTSPGPDVTYGGTQYFEDLFITPSVEYTGQLWSPHAESVRQVLDLLGHDFIDRLVLETPIEPPIDLSRPALMDACAENPLAAFTATNTTDASREVTLTWGDGTSPRFPFTVPSVELTLAPHASAEIAFPAEPGAWQIDSRDEHIQSNSVHLISGGDEAVGEAIPEWNAVHRRGEREIVLDGILEDWMGLWDWRLDPANTVVGPPGEHDATMRALWDDEALWIAAIAHDDDLLNPAPIEEPWSGDSLEIFLDLNAPDEIGQVGYNGRVFQIQVVPALPDLPEGNVMFSRPEGMPAEGIEHAVRCSEWEGTISMVHELRIPWQTLALSGPPEGLQIGFEWAVNDLDTDGMSRTQMVWRGTVDNWRDPSHFSRIHLLD